MIAPRLLTAAEAKAYLGGLSPKAYATPLRTPRGIRFDRAELDAKLDRLRGLNPRSATNDADAALQEWQSRHGAS